MLTKHKHVTDNYTFCGSTENSNNILNFFIILKLHFMYYYRGFFLLKKIFINDINIGKRVYMAIWMVQILKKCFSKILARKLKQ